MLARVFAAAVVSAILLEGAAKTVATARGENEDLILTVTLHASADEVKQFLGNDLGGHYFVAEVKVEPKYGKTVTIARDDFLLRSEKDNERTGPFAPSQVAGGGAVIVSPTKTAEKTAGGRPTFSGPLGFPSSGGGIGGGAANGDYGTLKSKVEDQPEGQENPLEKLLDTKMLPDRQTDQPVTGLLYFPMEKQKLKDLELRFGGEENRITLRFR